MFNRYCLWFSLIFVAILPTIAQQTEPSAKTPQGAGFPSQAFLAQALTANSSADTAALMDLQMKIEDATVRGDVTYVDSVTSPDFTMVHGDNWVTGGLAQLADDKAAYLKRVKDQFYYVHDLDPASIRFEMHKDIAICYGRYLSVTKPQAQSKNPGRITSIWFERVFQKQEWQVGLSIPQDCTRAYPNSGRDRPYRDFLGRQYSGGFNSVESQYSRESFKGLWLGRSQSTGWQWST